MKKTIKSLLVLCMVFFGLVALASCDMSGTGNGGSQECQHTPGASWRVSEEEHWHVCDLCSEHVDKAAHSFGDWVVMQEPAVGTAGRKVKTCSVCKYYIAEDIPAIEVATGETTADAVVFAQVPADWSTVNCYYWHNEAGTNNMDPAHKTSWPGEAMTLVDEAENIWAFVVPVGTANVIFNNGSTQTVDIAYATEANLYILSTEAGADGKLTANVGTYEYTGSIDDINKYVSKEVKPFEMLTIYVQVPESWPAVILYFWGGQGTCSGWPGDDVTNLVDEANRVHQIQVPNDVDGFVLSNGVGGDDNQTSDIKLVDGANAYIITEGTPKDTAAPHAYADGTFTPVEVAPVSIVYYVRGSMNSWGASEEYKFSYDAETDTATLTVTLAAGDQFKIAEEAWNDATTINAQGATYAEGLFSDVDGDNHNFQANAAGTYVFTITGVNSDARTCTIVAAE